MTRVVKRQRIEWCSTTGPATTAELTERLRCALDRDEGGAWRDVRLRAFPRAGSIIVEGQDDMRAEITVSMAFPPRAKRCTGKTCAVHGRRS